MEGWISNPLLLYKGKMRKQEIKEVSKYIRKVMTGGFATFGILLTFTETFYIVMKNAIGLTI